MEPHKEFFTIREVEKETGLPLSTLRYWEEQFDQLNPRKDGHGDRFYTEQDIVFIKQVKFIRDEMQITRIPAIKKVLASDKHTDARQRATEILMRLRQQLVDLRASI